MNKLLTGILLFLVGLSQALPSFNSGKADEACAAIGGTCMDWTTNKCTAGYETGLCSGDSNNRCCKNCDQTCQDNEAAWSSGDSLCNAAEGVCMQNSNYCDGTYSTGKCGGPSTRQCCQTIPGCPKIVSRAEWGARPPSSPPTSIGNNVPYQFVHHSEDWSCDDEVSCKEAVRAIQDYHMDFNGWADIGYSFLVGGDGNMYEGRGWNVQGAHTSGYNSVGYGTCFIGNFMTENPVQTAQDVYVKSFLECAVNLGKVSANYQMYGHRQAGNTDCPGDSLYRLIQTWPHWTPGSPAYLTAGDIQQL